MQRKAIRARPIKKTNPPTTLPPMTNPPLSDSLVGVGDASVAVGVAEVVVLRERVVEPRFGATVDVVVSTTCVAVVTLAGGTGVVTVDVADAVDTVVAVDVPLVV